MLSRKPCMCTLLRWCFRNFWCYDFIYNWWWSGLSGYTFVPKVVGLWFIYFFYEFIQSIICWNWIWSSTNWLIHQIEHFVMFLGLLDVLYDILQGSLMCLCRLYHLPKVNLEFVESLIHLIELLSLYLRGHLDLVYGILQGIHTSLYHSSDESASHV